MGSTFPDGRRNQTRRYDRASSVVFFKTKEAFGGLSNMAGGFPLSVNGSHIRTSEALYQACRFPHLPGVQRLIIEQRSPMTAKMKGKPYRQDSRRDWNRVRVNIMRWCLRVKLAQNWIAFSRLLLDTGNRPIVEQSRKDDFWGAKPADDRILVGMNVLGRLLMELREQVKSEPAAGLFEVQPLSIDDFLLCGQVIECIRSSVPHERRYPDTRPAEFLPDRGSSSYDEQLPLLSAARANSNRLREKRPRYEANRGNAELQSYPAMKDSGVQWLGAIPKQWDVKRGQAIFRCIDVRSSSGDEELLTVSSDRGVVPRLSVNVTMFKAESYVGYKLCWPGDLVINSLWAWGRGLGVSQYHGIVSSAYGVYRLRPAYGDYAGYMHEVLRSEPFNWELRVRSKGIWVSRLQLTDDAFLGAPLPLPPTSEQAAIVRFLDHADRRIRRYIRAKEKLIALLEEQKQAIIHQAATGQIDVRTGRPYRAYKASGLEGLREIPEHWEVVALKRMLTRLIDCEHKTAPAVVVSDKFVVRTTAVRAGTLRWEGTYRTDGLSYMEWTKRGVPQVGDVIFTREAPAGEACLVPEGRHVCLGQRTVLLRPRQERYDAAFLVHMIYAGPPRLRVQLASQGSTVGHFNVDDIGRLPVLAPPLEEQATIVDVVRRQTEGIDRARKSSESEVRLLSEYRTRLIADVVTGKLDVREAAAGLPEVDPLAAEDDSEDGSNPKVWSDGDELGVTDQTAETRPRTST